MQANPARAPVVNQYAQFEDEDWMDDYDPELEELYFDYPASPVPPRIIPRPRVVRLQDPIIPPTRLKEDDDGIEVLEEAPRHMRKKNNAAKPIAILDSDDEDEVELGRKQATPLSARGKRKHSPPIHRDPSPSKRRKSDQAKARGPPIQKTSSVTFVETKPGPLPGPSNVLPPPPPDPANLLPYVLELLPDVDPEWAVDALRTAAEGGQSEQAVAKVVDLAFQDVNGYPRSTKTGEGSGESSKGNGGSKAKEKAVTGDYKSPNYREDERQGSSYQLYSLMALEASYPTIPVPHIRATFHIDSKYTPAHYRLLQHSISEPKLYTSLKRPRVAKTPQKGKSKEVLYSDDDYDGAPGWIIPDDVGESEFEKEKKWLDNTLRQEKNDADAALSKQAAHDDALAAGEGIECGCCFGEEIWEELFQCNEGHLFCRECTTRHAENQLGEQKTAILCMDMSACTAPFPESELKRLLSDKSLTLYHRLKQNNELKEAGIPGLESCPGCDYAAVIDNPDEKLFRCENKECGLISCRGCWKKEHLPKTCEEMEADRKLDQRHIVEDAMSDALIRKCPKCAKPFLKETGCNKMACTCGALSCYVCRKEIHSYDHFDQDRGPYIPGDNNKHKKCPLWENNEAQRDADNVIAARDAAQRRVREAARNNGIDIGENDLDVVAPVVPNMTGVAGPLGMIPALQGGGGPAGFAQARFGRAGPARRLPYNHNPPPMYNAQAAEQHRLERDLIRMQRAEALNRVPPRPLPAHRAPGRPVDMRLGNNRAGLGDAIFDQAMKMGEMMGRHRYEDEDSD